MTLRTRILLSQAPLGLLLAGLGVAGFLLLWQMGGGIDAILRENYESVQAMFRLNEATERIDSSFQFSLSAQRPEQQKEAKDQFEANWAEFEKQYRIEANNVTVLPREQELVDQLRALKEDYRKRGVAFFDSARTPEERHVAYYGVPGDPGLLDRFNELKKVANEILSINRENMVQARDKALATAHSALTAFGVSLVAAAILVVGSGWYLLRTILGPIQAVTEAAHDISTSGQLDQIVPVFRRDELGRLAMAFNAMTHELRKYRRSNLDRTMRAQKTAQATIDSFSDPVLVVDPIGRAELVNPAGRSLFGVGPASEGEPGPVWQPPDALRQPLTGALQLQQTYQPEQFDQTIAFQFAGEDRTYLPRVRPIRDPEGNTLGAAVVLNDITRFRLLDQFKSDLVATVSHELKTPLTSVRLAVHVLLEETVGPLTPKQTELLVDARDNSERLLTLIEQLLALARLQKPEQRELEPQDPTELLRNAADSVRPRAEDKHIELDIVAGEPLPSIAIDPERIGQALANLLNNAITYTPPGGKVTLSATTSDKGVTLIVADTGVGIPPQYLPRVFDRFFRIPGQSDEAGTGLGLAIVKEVVTAHRGEVTCESEPGKGTTFRITLPLPKGSA